MYAEPQSANYIFYYYCLLSWNQEMALLKWNLADKLLGMSVNYQETNKTEMHPLYPKEGSFCLILRCVLN